MIRKAKLTAFIGGRRSKKSEGSAQGQPTIDLSPIREYAKEMARVCGELRLPLVDGLKSVNELWRQFQDVSQNINNEFAVLLGEDLKQTGPFRVVHAFKRLDLQTVFDWNVQELELAPVDEAAQLVQFILDNSATDLAQAHANRISEVIRLAQVLLKKFVNEYNTLKPCVEDTHDTRKTVDATHEYWKNVRQTNVHYEEQMSQVQKECADVQERHDHQQAILRNNQAITEGQKFTLNAAATMIQSRWKARRLWTNLQKQIRAIVMDNEGDDDEVTTQQIVEKIAFKLHKFTIPGAFRLADDTYDKRMPVGKLFQWITSKGKVMLAPSEMRRILRLFSAPGGHNRIVQDITKVMGSKDTAWEWEIQYEHAQHLQYAFVQDDTDDAVGADCVEEFKSALQFKHEHGKLLHSSWQTLLQDTNRVSRAVVDNIMRLRLPILPVTLYAAVRHLSTSEEQVQRGTFTVRRPHSSTAQKVGPVDVRFNTKFPSKPSSVQFFYRGSHFENQSVDVDLTVLDMTNATMRLRAQPKPKSRLWQEGGVRVRYSFGHDGGTCLLNPNTKVRQPHPGMRVHLSPWRKTGEIREVGAGTHHREVLVTWDADGVDERWYSCGREGKYDLDRECAADEVHEEVIKFSCSMLHPPARVLLQAFRNRVDHKSEKEPRAPAADIPRTAFDSPQFGFDAHLRHGDLLVKAQLRRVLGSGVPPVVLDDAPTTYASLGPIDIRVAEAGDGKFKLDAHWKESTTRKPAQSGPKSSESSSWLADPFQFKMTELSTDGLKFHAKIMDKHLLWEQIEVSYTAKWRDYVIEHSNLPPWPTGDGTSLPSRIVQKSSRAAKCTEVDLMSNKEFKDFAAEQNARIRAKYLNKQPVQVTSGAQERGADNLLSQTRNSPGESLVRAADESLKTSSMGLQAPVTTSTPIPIESTPLLGASLKVATPASDLSPRAASLSSGPLLGDAIELS